AHWGEPEAYGRVRSALDGLVIPWHPLIGNHDNRAAFLAGLPAVADRDGYVQFVLDTDAGRFIALDSLVEGSHGGMLDEARLAWLDARLAETADREIFLLLHHAPIISGIAGLDAIRLGDADGLFNVLAKYRLPRHIFFGHMHRSCHGSWRGIPFSTVKATAHQVHPDFGRDAPLTASRELPAYAVVLIGPEQVVVHDVSYLEEDTAFDYDRDNGSPDRQG
ncbi:MAG: metallophosphoesterase, partial [Proteobacteria bacterium]|nr:metallophosphoesterase [Pseudomonadota bacterium]